MSRTRNTSSKLEVYVSVTYTIYFIIKNKTTLIFLGEKKPKHCCHVFCAKYSNIIGLFFRNTRMLLMEESLIGGLIYFLPD